MRTVSAKSVCDLALQKLGMDPANGVQPSTLLALGGYLDESVRRGWEWSDWPELCATEERALRPEFDASVTNEINDEIHYTITSKYYRCIAANTGMDPTNASFWEVLGQVDPYLELEQRGQAAMGQIFALYSDDPNVTPNAPRYDFTDAGDRVWLTREVPETLWVKYRLPAPTFTRSPYDGAANYLAGDCVYYPTTGECYIARQAGTGIAPTDADQWAKQPLPLILRDYATRMMAANLQREDGQDAKADRLETGALEALQDEADKRLQTQATRQ